MWKKEGGLAAEAARGSCEVRAPAGRLVRRCARRARPRATKESVSRLERENAGCRPRARRVPARFVRGRGLWRFVVSWGSVWVLFWWKAAAPLFFLPPPPPPKKTHPPPPPP